tara:strand:- start:1105 stop:1287 length:183 start_codon:yes stop_codon:yes gene_type:complete
MSTIVHTMELSDEEFELLCAAIHQWKIMIEDRVDEGDWEEYDSRSLEAMSSLGVKLGVWS